MAQTPLTLDAFTSFGEMLKYLRKRARLSQRDLSVAVGYSETYITRLEGGTRHPDPGAVRALFIDALHLTDEPELAQRLIQLAEAISRARHERSQDISAEFDAAHVTRRSNLPAQLTAFIGRGSELAEVRRLLSTSRLVTLTGSGGVGKTRLALEAAASALETYANGIWLVELARISDPELVADTAAATFRLHFANRPPIEALLNHLRDRHTLLVLDNCEHLVQACAELADTLLRACPQLCILATSRERLNVLGEAAWRVPSLVTEEAVQLFEVRALAAIPESALADDDTITITQICERLDGIPLAIELAASRLRVYSLDMIAARLDDRFQLLTGGARTALPRHQTLHALIDWSYGLLSADEQRLLRTLSVFAGGWTLEAAEAVGAEMDVVTLLPQLVNKSLVVVIERTGEMRYTMLETIRQYASEQLAQSGLTQQVRTCHLEFFLHLAEEAEPWLASGQRDIWLRRFDTELDNIRVALAWCQETNVETGLNLISALFWFWSLRGHASEARRWLETGLAATEGLGITAARAKALYVVGSLAWLQFDIATACESEKQSVTMWRALGDQCNLAYGLARLGLALQSPISIEPALARASLLEGVALFRGLSDKWGLALSLNFQGIVLREHGDYTSAASSLAESMTLFRELEDTWGYAWPLHALGKTHLLQGNYAAACASLEEAAKLFKAAGDRVLRHYSLANLGRALHAEGRYPEAASVYRESLILCLDVGHLSEMPWYFAHLAGTVLAEGHAERAALLVAAAQKCIDSNPELRQADTAGEIGIALTSNLIAVRDQLGEAAFNMAWAEGYAMTMKQAIEYALSYAGVERPTKSYVTPASITASCRDHLA